MGNVSNNKVAIFIPSLRGGGAERVMVILANEFASRGCKVDLLLVKAEGPYLSTVSENVRIVDLNASRVLTSLPRLVRYLRRERPYAMLSALNHANVTAILAKWIARVSTRIVVSERNNVSLSMQFALGIMPRIVFRLMRLAYPYADSITAVSSGVADDLAQAIGIARERITVIYNPVMPVREYPSETIYPHPWFAPGSPPVIIGIGRLTKQKDFFLLIRAFAKVRIQRTCRLMILGEGELRGELEDLIEKLGLDSDVFLPGFVENPYSYLSRAGLFVLSSQWEGLPNVLIQALACGCPVVSTDCPSGPSEVLENGKWGRLVPVGNVDALAEAVLATLTEDTHPDVVSRARDFCVEQAATRYLDVLGMCL